MSICPQYDDHDDCIDNVSIQGKCVMAKSLVLYNLNI